MEDLFIWHNLQFAITLLPEGFQSSRHNIHSVSTQMVFQSRLSLSMHIDCETDTDTYRWHTPLFLLYCPHELSHRQCLRPMQLLTMFGSEPNHQLTLSLDEWHALIPFTSLGIFCFPFPISRLTVWKPPPPWQIDTKTDIWLGSPLRKKEKKKPAGEQHKQK